VLLHLRDGVEARHTHDNEQRGYRRKPNGMLNVFDTTIGSIAMIVRKIAPGKRDAGQGRRRCRSAVGRGRASRPE